MSRAKRVLIVGAGAAGLSAAIAAAGAANAGARVVLAEQNAQCGSKLLATGGGRCNASNLRPAAEWPALFGKNGRFIAPALEFLPLEKLKTFFAALGEPLAAADGFHLFPESQSARRVRDALRREAERLGAEIRTGLRCTSVITENGAAAGAEFRAAAGEAEPPLILPADAVLLATGGATWPATGADWSGCRITESLGHRVRPPTQGLVGLRTASVPPALSGLVLPDAKVSFKAKGAREETRAGELLLTHTGISGPAVLDLSAGVCEAAAAQSGPPIVRIAWRAGMRAAHWLERLDAWRQTSGGKTLSALLRGEALPRSLADWLRGKAGIGESATAAALRAAERDALAALLGDFPALVAGGEGMERAMITRGGVAVREVNPDTLESGRVRGLYFAGEMLDVDGPCGGYNLHWAFACGALAGASSARA